MAAPNTNPRHIPKHLAEGRQLQSGARPAKVLDHERRPPQDSRRDSVPAPGNHDDRARRLRDPRADPGRRRIHRGTGPSGTWTASAS